MAAQRILPGSRHTTCLPGVQPMAGAVRELREEACLNGAQKIQGAAGGLNTNLLGLKGVREDRRWKNPSK